MRSGCVASALILQGALARASCKFPDVARGSGRTGSAPTTLLNCNEGRASSAASGRRRRWPKKSENRIRRARERLRTLRPRAAPNPAQRGVPAAVCARRPTRMWSPCRQFSLNSADSQGIALCARGQARKVPWGARSNVARASPRMAPPQNPKRRLAKFSKESSAEI